jgi:hypothetical protein
VESQENSLIEGAHGALAELSTMGRSSLSSGLESELLADDGCEQAYRSVQE